MIPTEEQERILQAQEPIVVVDSRAGTGKTTQAVLIAKANPEKRILYLVFNKSQREHGKTVFPKNTTVHTVHSYSWECGGSMWGNDLGNFTPNLFLDDFEIPALATLTHQFLTFFMNSSEPTLRETVEPFLVYLNDYAKKIFLEALEKILDIGKQTLNQWYDREILCPHDFYLKISYLKGWVQNRLKSYDILILDEGQDLTRISLEMAKNFHGQVFLIGDQYQQLYAWRFAINAMDFFKEAVHYPLTKSFRFGGEIAELASTWIQESLDPDFQIFGNNELNTRVSQYDVIREVEDNSAVLHRTNLGIFQSILYLRTQDIPYSFERDLSPVLGRVLDLYFLYDEQPSKIRDEFVKGFKSFDEIHQYAEELEDYSLLSSINLVNRYIMILPGAVFDIFKEIKAHRNDPNAVKLSSVHSSKGCEYDYVYLTEDLGDAFAIEGRDPTEEFKAVYVAMTRVMKHLYVPGNLMGVSTFRWKNVLREKVFHTETSIEF